MAVCAMVALRILQRTQRVDVAPDRIKVHFMRFTNSYAAAVAAAVSAVVFSAAFQPAEAGFIWYAQNVTSPSPGVRIDGEGFFNTSTLLNGTSQSTSAGASVSVRTIYGGPITFPDLATVLRYSGTFISSSSGTVSPGLAPSTFQESTTNSGDLVAFNIASSGTYTLRLDPAYVSGSPLTNTMFFEGFTMAGTFNGFGWTAGTYQAPANNGLWVLSNGDTVQILGVPEPTQMVSVAGIGAAYGAWRLRKLRRSRTAAGDAIAS
jgi:hypothetical protein